MEFKALFNQLIIRKKNQTILLIPQVKHSNISQVTFPVPIIFLHAAWLEQLPAKWLLSLKNRLLDKRKFSSCYMNFGQ